MLVSAVRQHESATCKHTLPPFRASVPTPTPHATPLGCHRAPGWAPGEKTAYKGGRYDNSERLSGWIHLASWISLGYLLLQQSCPASALLITATSRAIRIKGHGPCAWSPSPGGSWAEPHLCIWNRDYRPGILHVASLILSTTLLLFSRLVVSDFLWPHRLQHTRPPRPSPTPGARSNSCPLSRRSQLTISSSVVPFSSYAQSFPASGSGNLTLKVSGIQLQNFHRTVQRLWEGTNKTLCAPGPRRKDQWPHKRLSQTCLWVFGSLWQWVNSGSTTLGGVYCIILPLMIKLENKSRVQTKFAGQGVRIGWSGVLIFTLSLFLLLLFISAQNQVSVNFTSYPPLKQSSPPKGSLIKVGWM